MSTEKKQIKVTEILTDLENGLTRKEIKVKYNLTFKEMQEVFKHEKLRFKKTRQKPNIEVIDDTEESVSDNVESADNIPEPSFD
jgi:hypothetical protein